MGRRDYPGVRRAGLLGLAVASTFMVVGAVAFLLLPEPLARVFTDDTAVVVVAVQLILVAAVFQISDGIQIVAAGALRGAGDTRSAFWANVSPPLGPAGLRPLKPRAYSTA